MWGKNKKIKNSSYLDDIVGKLLVVLNEDLLVLIAEAELEAAHRTQVRRQHNHHLHPGGGGALLPQISVVDPYWICIQELCATGSVFPIRIRIK